MAYNYTDVINNWEEVFAGGFLGGLLVLGIFLFILLMLAVYVYFAFSWYTIAKKRKHKKPWLAWIPFANISLWFQMGGFHWAWIFLLLIPVAGWIAVLVLFIISNWRVFEKLKYPGWLSLSLLLDIFKGGIGIIAYGVVVGIVAWKKPVKKIKKK
jgi:hypothetical protein